MKDFLTTDLNIEKAELACFVKAGTGCNVHTNRPSHGLALFCGGKRVFRFDSKKLLSEGNSIVYFPKGSNYTITNIEPADCYAINFQLTNRDYFEPFNMKVDNNLIFLLCFKNAEKIWNVPDVSKQFKIKSELYDIIYKMHNCTLKSKNNPIFPATSYIHENFAKENISVSHLAGLCGFSEVYLRRMFARQYGVSPNRYIKDLRLQYACELILSGFYKISEICYMSGFNDESYFNREFKKHFGKSPKEYYNSVK